MSADEFDTAKFFDCGEPETLSHQSPEEAIDDYFSNMCWDPSSSFEENLELACPIEVKAYEPKVVEEREIVRWTESLLETLIETYDEEYGDCLNGDFDSIKKSDVPACTEIMTKAVRDILKIARVWQCDEISTRKYSIDEVREIVKE